MKSISVRASADRAPRIRIKPVRTIADDGAAPPIRCVVATLSLLLLFGVPAKASTYYVSPSGRDANSCATAQSTTPSNQKQTISAGVACALAGDTVLIHAGTYTGTANVINSTITTVPSGTSASRITVSAYPGGFAASVTPGPRASAEVVTIQSPNGLGGILLTAGAPSFITVQDIIIDGVNNPLTNSGNGIYWSTGASHNAFTHLEVKNYGENGISSSNGGGAASFNDVTYSKLHDNGADQSRANPGYGIYHQTSNSLIEGNDIYNNHGYGIQMNTNSYGSFDNVSNNVIRKNLIHDNFPWSAGGVGGSTGGGFNVGTQDAPGHADGNQVYDNLIYHNGFGGSVAGVGILVYTYATGTLVYNNTVYNNNGEGIMMQYYDRSSPPVVRNNIVYLNVGTAIIDYGDATGGSGTPVVDSNLTTNPSFMNTATSDFHLTNASPARDTGTTVATVTTDFDGGVRPRGKAYDIGAYEYQGPSAPQALHLP